MPRKKRKARVERTTAETTIRLDLNLDGTGTYAIETGIGFFDHMLCLFAKHGRFDIQLACRGDLNVDVHHSVEDVGIVLGQAVTEALGDKRGIKRFGHAYVPMDESLARVCVDLSGRSALAFNAPLQKEKTGQFDTEVAPDFFKAWADNAKANLHIDLIRGTNSHHSIEAIFKAWARALAEAVSVDPRVKGVPSTKGRL